MTYKARRIIFALVVACLGTFLFGIYHAYTSKDAVQKSRLYSKQTLTLDELRIEVQPISLENELLFRVSIESFTRPNLARMNVQNTSLLIDQDENVMMPLDWKKDGHSDYSQTGVLRFPKPELPVRWIEVNIFGLSEYKFAWTL